MSIELTQPEHAMLNGILKKVLGWHQLGEISLQAAVGLIGHLMCASLADSEHDLKKWLRNPDILKSWKQAMAPPADATDSFGALLKAA